MLEGSGNHIAENADRPYSAPISPLTNHQREVMVSSITDWLMELLPMSLPKDLVFKLYDFVEIVLKELSDEDLEDIYRNNISQEPVDAFVQTPFNYR